MATKKKLNPTTLTTGSMEIKKIVEKAMPVTFTPRFPVVDSCKKYYKHAS
jgi:hypothetical protein